MKDFFLILLVLLTQKAFPQMQQEVIPTKEIVIAYSEPSETSTPVDTLLENEVFLITEYDDSNSEWIMVDIPQNKSSQSTSGKIDFFQSSFVKRAEIRLLDDLSVPKEKDVIINFQVIKADTTRHIPKENLRYGLEIPLRDSYRVSEMSLNWKGKRRLIDAVFYEDLFNVSFKEGNLSSTDNQQFRIYQKGTTYFIKQQCGDGSGAYEITWVIRDGEIRQRLIDEI